VGGWQGQEALLMAQINGHLSFCRGATSLRHGRSWHRAHPLVRTTRDLARDPRLQT